MKVKVNEDTPTLHFFLVPPGESLKDFGGILSKVGKTTMALGKEDGEDDSDEFPLVFPVLG
jgi:hypothetical protein